MYCGFSTSDKKWFVLKISAQGYEMHINTHFNKNGTCGQFISVRSHFSVEWQRGLQWTACFIRSPWVSNSVFCDWVGFKIYWQNQFRFCFEWEMLKKIVLILEWLPLPQVSLIQQEVSLLNSSDPGRATLNILMETRNKVTEIVGANFHVSLASPWSHGIDVEPLYLNSFFGKRVLICFFPVF